MRTLELWAINHKKADPDLLPNFGGIHYQFVVGMDDDGALDPRYCDMAAPYFLWQERASLPKIIGFHGYRKMLNFRDSFMHVGPCKMAPGWEEVSLDRFGEYKGWLSEWGAYSLPPTLEKYDLLTVEPFNCAYNGNMFKDYCVSRSRDDAAVLEIELKKIGLSMESTALIRPMHFVCSSYTFSQFMRFWNEIRGAIEPQIKSADARDPGYPPRALAMLSERIWSLWVDQAKLRIKTLPLMICWDAR